MNWCHVQLERAPSSLFFLRVYITLAWPFIDTSNGVCFHKLVSELYLHAINYSQLFKQYCCKLYVVKI